MQKIRLIYNAKAGQNKFKPYLDEIVEKICNKGFELTVYRASKGHDVDEFVLSTPADTYAIIVAGGDGTINRVVNIMMKNNIKVPLAVIPAGTSNDFATHIKMPTNFVECIDKILEGDVHPVDVGKVNDKYFINVLSAGMFASTSYKTDKRLKEMFGQLSYFMTAAGQTFQSKPITLKIETEDGTIREKALVFVVFNGSSVGRINKFTDNSSIQDGKLDLVLLRTCKINDAIRILGEIEDRSYMDDPNVVYLREKKYIISIEDGKCDSPDIDGDEGPEFPLTVECIENGLNMIM